MGTVSPAAPCWADRRAQTSSPPSAPKDSRTPDASCVSVSRFCPKMISGSGGWPGAGTASATRAASSSSSAAPAIGPLVHATLHPRNRTRLGPTLSPPYDENSVASSIAPSGAAATGGARDPK
eukprot:scaffold5958_cov109-Isochrysis_galbana.AAC.3